MPMTVWRLQVRDTDNTLHDVLVEADPTSPVRLLGDELANLGFRGLPVRVHEVDIGSVAIIDQLALRNGDIIECGSTYAAPQQRTGPAVDREPGYFVVTVAGPDAGHWSRLDVGPCVIGRSDNAEITLDDAGLSGHHVTIELHADGVLTVADMESTNGTQVEGVDIDCSDVAMVEPGQYVQVGATVLTVVHVGSTDHAVLGDAGGADWALPRRFRQANEPLPARLKRPKEPSQAEPAKTPWWRSLTPLVTGVGFALMTGRWQFLLIIALAPILFTYDAQRQRKRRKADRIQAFADHEIELAAFELMLAELRSTERTRRRELSCMGGIASFRATVRHRRLWERIPADSDFGSVAVGLAELPSKIDAGDDDVMLGRPTVWGTPLVSSFTTTGSLAITGSADRGRAIARSMLLELAATHSPADTRMWLFTEPEHAADWAFARWLPHTFSGPRTSTIALDASARAVQLQALKQLLDTRSDDGDKNLRLPLHVVVVDGSHTIPGTELTDLLLRGPELGVIGIVIDQTSTPEGTQAVLTTGETADDATFESRDQPLVKRVRTAEMPIVVAEQAARSLAALRPALKEASVGADGAIHLVDLLDIQAIDGADLLERWKQRSPQTTATVGLSSDTPMVIDIAEHGPHGLVGGMSGSGKTEFLMTFLTSLCLDNHPDDLGIVIVDFKGGVDHALTSRLPHVVGMSTNLHIEEFKRTIDLLDAEQRRRQHLFHGVGGDLDAYRAARTSNPSLPAIPRLLVIVDEFSELLASDEGKERLQELIRVTRIGRALGVHLLLVTQNFEGQLPPQVEANAGLRVCLRVMKPSHSKVVLDSGVAASIPDTSVGRAYARFHGRDLTEFQTARVAGRRRDLSTEPTPIDAQLVPLGSLAQHRGIHREAKAPMEETDMYALVEQLQLAAEKTGWTQSAIPWPADLPDSVPLRELLATHVVDEAPFQAFPIGLQDRPDEQAQTVLTLSSTDEQVLLLGGAGSGVTESLVSIATSAAVLNGPDLLHIHAIDLDGSGLARLAALPQTGTIATRDETLAFRLIEHLNLTVAERRATLVASGAATIEQHEELTGHPVHRIMLLVSGTERLIRRGEDTRSRLLQPLMTLLTESLGTGVQIIIGGTAQIADSRLALNVSQRFIFQLPGDASPTAYGVPRELTASLGSPGRAVDVSSKRLTQLAYLDTGAGSAIHTEIAARLCQQHPSGQIRNEPKVFVNVGWPLPLSAVPTLSPPAEFEQPLAIGIELDSGVAAWVDADEDGPLFVVTGPPKSGRSTALIAIAAMAGTAGWTTIAVPGSRRSPLVDSSAFDVVCSSGELAKCLAQLPPDARVVIMLDDAQRIEAEHIDFAGLAGRPHAVFLAGPLDFVDGRSDLRKKLPAHRGGLLLSPSGALDGSAVGLTGRLDDDVRVNPRPGRGLLAITGEHRQLQVPLP
ncbi:MAG: S-DNA-T family DNA segregation ATPase FtsK/SpoIIIE [Acidimicrobiales bacterium]|jgi:S-DNA-T family DNA segregation ATPase FtsK/SpoIIIE